MKTRKNNLKKIIESFLNQEEKKLINDFNNNLEKKEEESVIITTDIVDVLKKITSNKYDNILDDFKGKSINPKKIPKEILNILRIL